MSRRGVFTMEMSCFGGAGGGIRGPGLSKGVQDGGMADSDLPGGMQDNAACCRLLVRPGNSSTISMGLSATSKRQIL